MEWEIEDRIEMSIKIQQNVKIKGRIKYPTY